MNIKKIVKLSFVLISILILLIFFINTIVLKQIKENDTSKSNIEQLVSMQENMNSLVKEVISSKTQAELKSIQKEFWGYEERFEEIRESIIKKEDDFFDFFIKDIHQHKNISSNLKKLYINEKEIEEIFERVFSKQKKVIELKNLFKTNYPKESFLRNKIETKILETKNINLIKQLSDIKYYSKEMLFQHKNNEYFSKWIDKIKALKENYKIDFSKEYLQIAEIVGNYILEIEEIKNKEIILQKEINSIIKTNKEINTTIQNQIDKLSNDFLNNTYYLVLTLLALTILFIILFSYKVNKNVALSVDEIEHKVEDGLKTIKKLNHEIEDTQKEVVFTMGSIGESRSKETGNHVKRVAEYSKILALHYGLPKKEAELLKQASPMHDIGKVAIPDSILNKPGRFDEKEREIMNTHAQLGYEMLKHSNRPLLKAAAIVSLEHHEKWDGTGYPRGLKGEEIDIYGRITAIADVFDALGSDRCYKKAWDDEKIFKLFKKERAKHFDPKLVDIFFKHLDEFLEIRNKFKDV